MQLFGNVFAVNTTGSDRTNDRKELSCLRSVSLAASRYILLTDMMCYLQTAVNRNRKKMRFVQHQMKKKQSEACVSLIPIDPEPAPCHLQQQVRHG